MLCYLLAEISKIESKNWILTQSEEKTPIPIQVLITANAFIFLWLSLIQYNQDLNTLLCHEIVVKNSSLSDNLS